MFCQPCFAHISFPSPFLWHLAVLLWLTSWCLRACLHDFVFMFLQKKIWKRLVSASWSFCNVLWHVNAPGMWVPSFGGGRSCSLITLCRIDGLMAWWMWGLSGGSCVDNDRFSWWMWRFKSDCMLRHNFLLFASGQMLPSWLWFSLASNKSDVFFNYNPS